VAVDKNEPVQDAKPPFTTSKNRASFSAKDF
jgi:hypothetical protein